MNIPNSFLIVHFSSSRMIDNAASVNEQKLECSSPRNDEETLLDPLV